ncbi:MAG: hypothetical protein ACQESP_00325 [Candidatus Muiribacteriota bacterium]
MIIQFLDNGKIKFNETLIEYNNTEEIMAKIKEELINHKIKRNKN